MIAYLTAIDRRDGLAVSAEANVGVPTLCRSQNRQLMMGRAV